MKEAEREQDETVNCGLSMAERELLQSRLRELEDTPPPRAVWQRIEEQARAEGLFATQIAAPARWLAGAGLAAAVVLAVLNVPFGNLAVGPGNDAAGNGSVTVPPYEAVAGNQDDLRGLNALMVQSRQLERNLRALPAEPSVVRAGTAATISELQDQIAAIDYLLNHPDLGLTPAQEEIYWRERVRLMNSLLQLRRAQTQRMSF